MSDFEYSVEARNVLNRFYNVDNVVYVEGEDDISFWEIIFDKLAGIRVEIKVVGGKNELIKLAKPVFEGCAEYLVAMDSDFDCFKDLERHPNVIRTMGYSIENTLVTNQSLAKLVKFLARVPNGGVPLGPISDWLEVFGERAKRLIFLDVVNEVEGYGVDLGLDNSEKFMVSKKSCDLCAMKVEEYIKNSPVAIPVGKEEEIDEKILNMGYTYVDFVRGHFLFSGASRFIRSKVRSLGKNISLSKDAVYSNLISVFESSFDENHPHYKYYEEEIGLVGRSG